MASKPKTPATGANPQNSLKAASDETVKTEISSGGGPTAAGIASAANAGEVGGTPTSKPEAMVVVSGTNTSEESATATVEAGNTAGLAAVLASSDLMLIGVDIAEEPSTSVFSMPLPPAEEGSLEPKRGAFIEGTRYPLLTDFFFGAAERQIRPSAFRVTSAVEGFRRAGMRHAAEPQDYPLDHFDPDQLEILLGEPTLTVELI